MEAPAPQIRSQKAWFIDCSEPWFTHIAEGRKPVEGKKNSPTWKGVAAGDRVTFRDPGSGRTFLAAVTGVNVYAPGPGALRRYLEGEGLARALPGVATLADGEAVYTQPGWSTHEEVERYGMLGIQVEVLERPPGAG